MMQQWGPMTTVLIADDQLEIRSIHGSYLQQHGYEVITADDGDTALAKARAHMPDIILLDHTMPRRTGIDVARALKADPATAGIPIVMMTAHPYGAIGRKARDAGCVSFIPKPCGPRRLLAEVLRLTGAAPVSVSVQ
jgi:two-component system, cell cycle response regulator DivK